MSKIVQIAHDELSACQEYLKGQDALGATAPPVTWVDDLAIPLATADAVDLIPLIQTTTQILLHSSALACRSTWIVAKPKWW